MASVLLAGSLAGQTTDGAFESWYRSLEISVVAEGVGVPSAMAFLPDGRLLVGDRPAGLVRILERSGGAEPVLIQVAETFQESGAGVHDLALHPDFADNGWVYVSYTAVAANGAHTLALDRFRIQRDTISERERLFEAAPAVRSEDHYGGRIALDGTHVYLTSGDRRAHEHAPDPGSHIGKILRLHDDGRVPDDNPFTRRPGARPEIWSLGHRNPQGLAFDGEGRLWSHEHGPRGGDEINLIRPGADYGWPRVSHGGEYDGGPVGEGASRAPGVEPPVWVYRPSIGPSGLAIYSGRLFPEWEGALLIGALGHRHLGVVSRTGDRVQHVERILESLGERVRSVIEAPDGSILVGTDEGRIYSVRPGGAAGG